MSALAEFLQSWDMIEIVEEQMEATIMGGYIAAI